MKTTTASTEGKGSTMYKHTLKLAVAAAVVGLAIPTAAYGMPTDQTGGKVVVATPSTVVSEKVAGLNLTPSVAVTTAPIVSEKVAGLDLTPTIPLTKGPVQTSQPEPVSFTTSYDTGFSWGDFGIGAGVMFGSLVALTAAAGAVRRHHHHGHLAH